MLIPLPCIFFILSCEIPCVLPLFFFFRGILLKNTGRRIPVFAFYSIICYFCIYLRANFIIYRKYFPVNRCKIEESSLLFLHIPPLFPIENPLVFTHNTSRRGFGHIRKPKVLKNAYDGIKIPWFLPKHRSQRIGTYLKPKRRRENAKKLTEWKKLLHSVSFIKIS